MNLIAYYEGSAGVVTWLEELIGPDHNVTFRKLPTSNLSDEFTQLPAYVADILYLDKPDIILSGITDGAHEKPLLSIELASCTPQYQHALQRFSRMMASVVNGCPSVLVMADKKKENAGGDRTYTRSRAVEYGAVRLMDIYHIPAFIFDWPQIDGVLQHEGATQCPSLATPSMTGLRQFVREAIGAFQNLDYVEQLWRLPLVRKYLEITRTRAYTGGPPTIEHPGGGAGDAANLELTNTADLLGDIRGSIPRSAPLLDRLPQFISNRPASLVFSPTRVMDHAGDPYVGMVGYYDIAFCRIGRSTRERQHNLVADCRTVNIAEVENAMTAFNENKCPFSGVVNATSILRYSYHLKNGCRETKPKPIRIYGELADIMIFSDRILFNVG